MFSIYYSNTEPTSYRKKSSSISSNHKVSNGGNDDFYSTTVLESKETLSSDSSWDKSEQVTLFFVFTKCLTVALFILEAKR